MMNGRVKSLPPVRDCIVCGELVIWEKGRPFPAHEDHTYRQVLDAIDKRRLGKGRVVRGRHGHGL